MIGFYHVGCEKGNLMANVSVAGFEWMVQASLVADNGSQVELIGETRAALDNDGYVRFATLGVSVAQQAVTIQYSFALPVGVNK